MRFKSHLNKIKEGNPNFKWENKKKYIFFNFRERIINLFTDYSFLLSESKYKAKHGEGLKILNKFFKVYE